MEGISKKQDILRVYAKKAILVALMVLVFGPLVYLLTQSNTYGDAPCSDNSTSTNVFQELNVNSPLHYCAAAKTIYLTEGEIDQVGTITSGTWHGTPIESNYLNEADPQVGSLTNSKWCTTDGTIVNCASDAPVLTEADPQVGTLESDKFCTSNSAGTAVNCTTASPIPVANGGTGVTSSTGTGSVVLNTSANLTTPTITTSATVPLVLGGTAQANDLTLQTTSFAGDNTNGDMHFLVGNNGSTEAMTILNNGMVGIGNTAPTGSGATLHIGSSTSGAATLVLQDNEQKWTIIDDNTLRISLNDVEKLRIDTAGNVGIGTTTPGSHLEISGGNLHVNEGSSYVTRTDNDPWMLIGEALTEGTYGYIKWNRTSDLLQLATHTGGIAITLNESGKVGIGTTSPSHKLHVVSTGDGDVFKLEDSDGNCSIDPDGSNAETYCYSDASLKKNIRPAEGSLNKYLTYQIRTFEMKSSGQTETGVVAQELQEVDPASVVPQTFEEKLEDGTAKSKELLTVKQPNPWEVIKAIQELDTKIESRVGSGLNGKPQPSCDSAHRGVLWFVVDDKAGDHEEVCGRDSAGNYSWNRLRI